MNNHWQTIILNGEKASAKELENVATSLCNREVIREKGGFLFKFSCVDSTACLGVLPFFIGTDRMHHYDIRLPLKDPHRLTGFINSDCTLTILFNVDKKTLENGFSPEAVEQYTRRYRDFAALLLTHGFDPFFPLDSLTLETLTTMGLAEPSPPVIGQLRHPHV